MKKDDFLGSATVDLRSLERQPKVSFDVKLSTQGTVVLRAGWGVTRDQAPGGAAAPPSDITANAAPRSSTLTRTDLAPSTTASSRML